MIVNVGDTVTNYLGDPATVVEAERYEGTLCLRFEFHDFPDWDGICALVEAAPPSTPIVGWLHPNLVLTYITLEDGSRWAVMTGKGLPSYLRTMEQIKSYVDLMLAAMREGR